MNPLFDNLIKQKKLSRNIFSFYLNRNLDKSESRLVIGGVDSSLYEGKIKYHKVVDQYYWTIIADKILVGGEDLGICNKCKVVVDTGTSLITGPYDDLEKLLCKISYYLFMRSIFLNIFYCFLYIFFISILMIFLKLYYYYSVVLVCYLLYKAFTILRVHGVITPF